MSINAEQPQALEESHDEMNVQPQERATQAISLSVMHIMAGAQDGGAEMAYVDMCLAMRETGIRVTAVCRPNDKRNSRLREAGVEVYELPFRGWVDLWTTYRLKKLIKDIKPDIVQSWMARATWKLPSKPDTGKPLIYIARLGGYYNIKKYYKRVDIFIGCTPDICKHIAKAGIEENRIQQLNNFAETESEFEKINRADMTTSDDAFVYLTLARLHKAKAIDTLLNAFVDMPEHAVLWIAGQGPDEKALKEQCAQLGLEDRVRFLGWRMDRAALLEACDAVVFPSRHEPFGSTFVQAWASNRPLVTTASQGPKQYVINEQDALLVEIDNVEDLNKAMKRVIEDAKLRQHIVKNGYQRYRNEFEKNLVVKQTLEFYRKTLENNQKK